MADIFSKEKRSDLMRNVGPKNSKQELIVRKLIHGLGYRYRLHKKGLPGSPDLVFPKYYKVIFVNGCFWHGCENCYRSRLPKTNLKYWKQKIKENKERDLKKIAELESLGWGSMIIWQCELDIKNADRLIKRIKSFLHKPYKESESSS
jgi:DNA mismatch endonuclease (patch repair protein)